MTLPHPFQLFLQALDFTQSGHLSEAETLYRQAIDLLPNFAEAKTNLGQVLALQGFLKEAKPWFLEAIADKPLLMPAYANLVLLFYLMGDLEAAQEACLQAIAIHPTVLSFKLIMAQVSYKLGDDAKARDIFQECLRLDPSSIEAQLGWVMAQLPMVYDSTDQLEGCRAAFQNALNHLENTVNSGEINHALSPGSVGVNTPFYLAYQGHCDKSLMVQFGRLFSSLNTASIPKPRSIKSRDRLRVGIVSGFFSLHTIYKLMIKGWVSQLDKQQFEVFAYSTRLKQDEHTAFVQNQVACFRSGDSFEKQAAQIEQDQPDILIYPEVGMDLVTYQLATCRLAPVQCVSWGHPTTTGLPTIDYMLSSDLMEVANAQDHYTEKLIRLPHLGIYYDMVTEPLPHTNTLKLELPFQALLTQPGRVRYLCCQTLPKYLPQYDCVWVEIAKKVPSAQFIFLTHSSRSLTERFIQRVSRAFAEARLNPQDFIVVMPPLSFDRYLALNGLADIYLDSIGWSGGNTTLEAVAYGLPVVTWPQELMRSRHAGAILARMGLAEYGSDSRESYVQQAVLLGLDSSYRQVYSSKIQQNKAILYQDKQSMSELEAFLVSSNNVL